MRKNKSSREAKVPVNGTKLTVLLLEPVSFSGIAKSETCLRRVSESEPEGAKDLKNPRRKPAREA